MVRTFEDPMAGFSRICMLASPLFLMLLLATPIAAAQDAGPDFDPHPLGPADTSSPRDTLRSYLTNVNEAINGWRRDAVDM